MKYALIDSGDESKLESFGPYLISRPCSQALWKRAQPQSTWDEADAVFTRESGNKWSFRKKLPDHWSMQLEGLTFKLAPTDFGHLGIFPEHALLWKWMEERIKKAKTPPSVLNLFAYSGGASLAAARAGASVCHLDASKGMVSWARENAALSDLEGAPIRWIVDDVVKFLERESRRGRSYDGIILDPPSFGRGSKGEVFKIERDLWKILDLCKKVLTPEPLFVILSSHTPGMTPLVMHHIMQQMMAGYRGAIDSGELILTGDKALEVPCGGFARWS